MHFFDSAIIQLYFVNAEIREINHYQVAVAVVVVAFLLCTPYPLP